MHMNAFTCPIPNRHFPVIRIVKRFLHIKAVKPTTRQIIVTNMQDIHASASLKTAINIIVKV